MTLRSVYVIPCECGKTVRSEERETVCPSCRRVLIVEWGAPEPAPLQAVDPPLVQAAKAGER